MRDLFLERYHKKTWDEKDDRDDKAFLDLERKIYREVHPHSSDFLDDDEEDQGSNDMETELLVEELNNIEEQPSILGKEVHAEAAHIDEGSDGDSDNSSGLPEAQVVDED